MIFNRKLRYILVETSDTTDLRNMQTVDELKRGMLGFLGELPFFKANPQLITQMGERVFVLSANRGYERSVILALTFIKSLGGRKVGFYTIRTSGTMRSLRSYFSKNYRRE